MLSCSVAVTLEGTIIHKSGLMTGGRSSHGNGKKWEDKDVQGLHRVRDKLLADLQALNKTKPRGNADDNLLAEITRLEPALAVARDDLVSPIFILEIEMLLTSLRVRASSVSTESRMRSNTSTVSSGNKNLSSDRLNQHTTP